MGVRGAVLIGGGDPQAGVVLLGDDVDDPGDGVRAVQGGAAVHHDFHPVDGGGGEFPQVGEEFLNPPGRPGHAPAIEQHQGVGGTQAAQVGGGNAQAQGAQIGVQLAIDAEVGGAVDGGEVLRNGANDVLRSGKAPGGDLLGGDDLPAHGRVAEEQAAAGDQDLLFDLRLVRLLTPPPPLSLSEGRNRRRQQGDAHETLGKFEWLHGSPQNQMMWLGDFPP